MGDTDSSPSQLTETVDGLRERGIHTAHVGVFDLMGTFRERRLGVDDIACVYDGGGTVVNVLHQWDAAETVFGDGPFVGERVSVDPGSVRNHPFETDACILIADFDGPSAAISPRRLLQSQIAKAEQLGIGVRAGFEFEFFVLDQSAASLRDSRFGDLVPHAKDNRCWAGESAATHAQLIAKLDDVLTHGEVDLLALGPELGPGCFEATLRHTNPLRAADDAALFKMFTKVFCRQQDLTASFMAQLDAGFPGLSGHIHVSLFDQATGESVFADRDDKRGMSLQFRQFVAGMLRMAPEAMPMTHNTTNAYRRHAPGNWAPKSASWAVQNYAAAVRVVPEPVDRCRLEYRLPGADINPHLGLAFVLGAGLWGLAQDCALPDELTSGAPQDAPAQSRDDEHALPHDLFTATERMAASSAAEEIWSKEFITHFARACRAEEAALRRETSAAERARYLEVV